MPRYDRGPRWHERDIRFERERAVAVHYRGHAIPGQRIDLIVENVVLVELKATTRTDPSQPRLCPW